MIRTVHHVQLAMPPGREDDADSFYVGVLGLKPVPKPANLAARRGRWFCCDDGFEVHLGVEEGFVPAQKAHPALLVDDIARLRTVLRGAGASVVDDKPLDGFDRFYTQDPFGNRIEILSASLASES